MVTLIINNNREKVRKVMLLSKLQSKYCFDRKRGLVFTATS